MVDKVALRKDILVTEDDYKGYQEIRENLPKIYTMEINSDLFHDFEDTFNRKIHGDVPMVKRLIDITIPADDDPTKYWPRQFIKVVDASDKDSCIDYIFKVMYVDIEDDEQSFVVSVVPLRKKKIQEIEESIRKTL